jgi:hypothetical protein
MIIGAPDRIMPARLVPPGTGRTSRTSRGRDPQHSRQPGRQPPVGPAEQRDHRRDQQAAHDHRVDQDAGPQPGGQDLQVGLRAGGHGQEAQHQDRRRAGDQAPGPAQALHHGVPGVTRTVIGLPDAGEDEHLVVHRQAEQEREHHQRHPHRDRPGGRDAPQRPGAVPVLPHPRQHAVGGGQRDQVEHHRLGGQQHRAEGPGQQQEGGDADDREHQREVAVDRVVEVDQRRPVTADADHTGAIQQRVLQPGDGRLSGRHAALGHRDHGHDRRAVPLVVRRGRRHRGVHARHPRRRDRDRGRSAS